MQRLLLTATARDVNCRLWSRHEGHRKRQDIVIFLSLQPPAELRIWGWVQLGTGRGWQCREASHCPAMASALTVLFLGCCLAGQSRAREQGSPKNGNKQTDSKQRAEGPLPKPSISASPGGVIPVWGNVTIRCWTEQPGWRFLLYKDGAENYQIYRDPAGSETEFTIIITSQEHGGNYTCRYSNRAGAAAYSAPSDPVQIMVLDAGSTSAEGTHPTPLDTLSAPSPSATHAGSTPARGTNQGLLGATSTPSPSATDAGSIPTRGTHPTPLDTLSTPSPSATHAGSTPSRGTNQSLLGTTSTPSPSPKDASSIPTRGTHPTTLETTAAQTQPGELGSDLSGAIVAGVIVGATGLLLLLLLLGFHHRRRTRAREGPALKQSRESEAATTVYALAGLGKQQDVPKPDPGAEGLTYTELDRQALQAKRDAQVPAPEPVLYATVSGSQGAPQLTP